MTVVFGDARDVHKHDFSAFRQVLQWHRKLRLHLQGDRPGVRVPSQHCVRQRELYKFYDPPAGWHLQRPRDLLAKHANLHLRPKRLRRLHTEQQAVQLDWSSPEVRQHWPLGQRQRMWNWPKLLRRGQLQL
jgi:hypothetical protein